MRSLQGRALAAVLGAVTLACQTSRIAPQELPETPIAFNYRTPEEARRRADAWKDQQDKGGGAARRPQDEDAPAVRGHEIFARADEVRDYFARVFGRGDETKETYPGRLALLDPRSGTLRVIEAARRGSVPLEWSPDHQRLLLAQPDERDFQLYEYEPGNGTVRPITHGPVAHTQGCYASEGRIVVAAVDVTISPPRSRVEVSRAGGRGPFEPLSDWGNDHSPTCAPDGSAVVWVHESDEGRAELRMRAPIDTGETRVLALGRQPRFSRDGAWIVYSAPLRGDWRIWRMRSDGTGRAPIGSGQRSESRPALSPDGAFVVYVASEEPPRKNLYLRRFDGSGDRILFADGDGENPVW